jgi:uncharacterized membrane-anchored protein
MSVEKPSHIERPHRQAERTSGSGNAPQPKKLVFDPVQTAIERQITQEKPVDAFTAAMREAQDGDSEEAIARRLALGGEQKDLIDDQIETKRQKRPRSVHRADEEPEADNSKQDTQKTKNVQRSGAVERYVTPETTTNSAKRVSREQSHQHLMMFSVSMDRNQTATHVAQNAALRVQDVLAGGMWERDASRGKRLKIEQILKVS